MHHHPTCKHVVAGYASSHQPASSNQLFQLLVHSKHVQFNQPVITHSSPTWHTAASSFSTSLTTSVLPSIAAANFIALTPAVHLVPFMPCSNSCIVAQHACRVNQHGYIPHGSWQLHVHHGGKTTSQHHHACKHGCNQVRAFQCHGTCMACCCYWCTAFMQPSKQACMQSVPLLKSDA